jgi:predicted nucleic acid-binding protein
VLIVDASVLIKLFKPEADTAIARGLIGSLVRQKQPFAAPSVALYEVLSNALHFERPFVEVAELFTRLRGLGPSLEEPTAPELARAQGIAMTRAPIGGYPALYDSIYHAMAIERAGTFVTADARHVAKTAHLGHVRLLADWRPG